MKFNLRHKQIAVYFCTILTLGLTVGVFGPTVDELARNVNSDVPTLGFLMTARGFGGLVTALGSGFLLEKFSGHRLLAFFLSGVLIAMILTPFMVTLNSLIGTFALMGMSIGGVITSVNALCMWSSRENTAMTLNLVHGSFGVGSFLAPVVALLSDTIAGTYNGLFFLVAGCCALLITCLLFIPSPVCPDDSSEKDESLVGTSKSPTLIKPTYLMIILGFLSILLAVGPEHTFGSWVDMYSITLGMSKAEGKYITTAYWVSFTIGRFVIAGLLGYFSLRKIFAAELVLCGVAATTMLIYPEDTTIIWAIAVAFGFGISGVFSNILGLASSYYVITGRINGVFSMGFSAGDVLTPTIVTALMGKNNSNYGPIAFVWSIAVMTLLIIVFTGLTEIVSKRERMRQMESLPNRISQ